MQRSRSARRLVLPWVLLLAATGGVAAQSADDPPVTVPLTVDVRSANGRPLPCLISFRHLASGEWIQLPQPFLSGGGTHRSARPQWSGKYPIHTNGRVTAELAPGDYEIVAGKGLTFEPVHRQVSLVAGRPAEIAIELRRFVRMKRRGWWSGDTHVHAARPDSQRDQELLWAAQAENVHVSSVLQMTWNDGLNFEQYAFGAPGTARDGNFWLVPGQEEPRTHQLGHVIVLNAPAWLHNEDESYLYDLLFEDAHRVGALAGLAHYFNNKFHGEWGGALLFPKQLVDFVELLDNDNQLSPAHYYDALNLGFRVGLVAGSDFPWGQHIGDQRVFAWVDPRGPFTLDRWFDAIDLGRTFISQGPLLQFTIDDVPIGGEVRVQRGQTIRLRARAVGHPEIGAPERLTIVSMGDTVREIQSPSPSQRRLYLASDLVVERSGWYATVAVAHNGAVAHSSPIYVVVDDEPVVASGEKLELALQRALSRLNDIRDGEFVSDDPDVRELFRAWVSEAIAFYANEPYRPPIPGDQLGAFRRVE